MPSIRFPRLRLIPPRDGWERGMVAVLLALAFLILNEDAATARRWFLHFRNPQADSLATTISLLLPCLLVLCAALARRSPLRLIALWLGIPAALLGLMGIAAMTCFEAEAGYHTSQKRLGDSLPLSGRGATLEVIGTQGYGVEIVEDIAVLPGVVLTRSLYTARFSGQHVRSARFVVLGPRRVRVVLSASKEMPQESADLDLDLPVAGR